MQFKLKREFRDGEPLFLVFPQGYDYGRGFSTLELAFSYIKLILRNQ